ncbi:MAG: PilZ domain-containing protein [Nitrospiraceae bacterium]|nr:PilZ domain-containing protein [Nitrospiraceae bacterium]
MEKILGRFRVCPFRCQLCTMRFRAFWAKPPDSTHSVDRRQYKRLPASFHAELVAENAKRSTHRITEISMEGCTLETSEALPRGSFFELMISPASETETITIETAMVCSARQASMGVRFLELQSTDKQRLSQVVLSLLVGQRAHPSLTN